MNFDFIAHNLSPTTDLGNFFIWYMKLDDDSIISEWDNNRKHNQIEDMKEYFPRMKEMGLLGNGGRVFIDPDNGEIHIGGDRIARLYLQDQDEKIYNITNNPASEKNNEYREFITRKYVTYDISIANNTTMTPQNASLDYITMGYKVNINTNNNLLKCLVQYGLQFNKPQFIDIEITPEKDFKGNIILKYGTGSNEEKGKIDLLANTTSHLKISF